jgi:TorA maturation chaperone TorD
MKRSIELLAQADLLLMIADLFSPPEHIRHAFGSLKKSNLKMLAESTGLPEKKLLGDLLQVAVKAVERACPEDWSACYRTLFDGAILCPINEAAYIRRDKGAIMGDVCGFYRAFGWTTVADSGERPDHFLVEIEFCAILLVMVARAETEEQRSITESALAEFTRQHLNDWLPLFSAHLRLVTDYPVLVAAANLLEQVWPDLIAWHGWVVDGLPAEAVGVCEEPENPYECGAPGLVNLK